MNSKKTHFGFKEVNAEEKSTLVKEVFSNVATKYDLMNDIMSLGVHRLWKRKIINKINFKNNIKIIDVAGGTADISFQIAKFAQQKKINYYIEVVDINQEMLTMGKNRAIDKNIFHNINFTCCDGEKLCFEDNSFDVYTIAFGIRNFTNIDKALSEAYRVLKKGGLFICLEFSKVEDYFLQNIYNKYSFKIIPKLGEIILKDSASYQYLVESIRKFPDQKQFAKMILEAGFTGVNYDNLNFGISALHYAQKI